MFVKNGFLLLTFYLTTIWGQNDLVSICPDIFKYDTTKNEENTWSGEISVNSEFPLGSLWIKVVLDEKAELVNSTHGETETEDNKEFLIKYPITKTRGTPLIPGEITKVPFIVKYDPSKPIPKVTALRVNARPLCPAEPLVGISNCPGIFTYDVDQKGATDRVYGTLRLTVEYPLQQVWIEAFFDKPVEEVGSESGGIAPRENSYMIYMKNISKAGEQITVPIFIKYNKNSGIPNIRALRINSRTICGEIPAENRDE